MALTQWQRRYRWFIFRFPRIAAAWRWLAWKLRDPGAPAGCHMVEPFPRWFGMTEAEEEWAIDAIKRYEAGEE